MATDPQPAPNLFLDVLATLERLQAPYMVVGAFAAIIYGVQRTTYDIDVVVDLDEQQIQAFAAAYPSPRYCADPEQMRESIRLQEIAAQAAGLGTITLHVWNTLQRKAEDEIGRRNMRE